MIYRYIADLFEDVNPKQLHRVREHFEQYIGIKQ